MADRVPTRVFSSIRAGRRFVFLFGLLAALFVATGFLVSRYRTERLERGQQLFERGQKLVAEGHVDEGIRHLRAALALTGREDYALELARSLVQVGRYSEAEAYLANLLEIDPTQGMANLLMARALVGLNQYKRALQYYRRALFSEWTADQGVEKLNGWIEFVTLLIEMGQKNEALAQLLELVDEVAGKPDLQRRVAELFLQVQSPEHAAEVYRQVIAENPQDVEARIGLGRAELERGRFLTARTVVRQALTEGLNEPRVQQLLATINELLDLDPTLPYLGTQVRQRRSLAVLQRVVAVSERCLASQELSFEANQELQSLYRSLSSYLESVNKNKKLLVRMNPEERLEDAVQLWHLLQQACPQATENEVVLSLLMNKLSRIFAT